MFLASFWNADKILHFKYTKVLDDGFIHRRGLCLCYFIFFFNGCAALKLYLDAIIVDDYLFYQLLDDRVIVYVHDVALDVFHRIFAYIGQSGIDGSGARGKDKECNKA